MLAEWKEDKRFSEAQLTPARVAINDMLAEYFGIDQEALEREKRAMLEDLRR